ncbi:MAG: corrinoid protein [candidate division WOR-3 bacterium]|nr:corrinoid protein [candidate division WOR-3 bacterium]
MDFSPIKKAIVSFEEEKIKKLIEEFIEKGIRPQEILEHGLIPGMKEVGRLFEIKEYYVPEVLLAAETFYAGFNMIKPLLIENKSGRKGRIVIGVVQGDIHDIGKNIVKVMLEASGYDVIDLGKDVPNERFIEVVDQEKPDILALSSLMTTTMVHMEIIIKLLNKKRLRKTVKVIVGGAPITQEYADKIGADGYAEDAAGATRLVDRLLQGNE